MRRSAHRQSQPASRRSKACRLQYAPKGIILQNGARYDPSLETPAVIMSVYKALGIELSLLLSKDFI